MSALSAASAPAFPVASSIKLVLPEHIEARDLYVIAAEQGVQIRRMNQRRDSLEDIFLRAMGNTPTGIPATPNEIVRPEHVRL